MIRSIAHATDMSPESVPAFEHALRLALLNRSEFTMIHVRDRDDKDSWNDFPGVRETMIRWGFLPEGTKAPDVLPQTGVSVAKYDVYADDVVHGLTDFLRPKSPERQAPDLLVMSSHGRAGIEALFSSSVAASLAHASMIPTLIFGPRARPFVDSDTGRHEAIRNVMVPIDHQPSAQPTLRRLYALMEGLNVQFDYVHVGSNAPLLFDREKRPLRARTIEGSVVETLLAEAERADLIAMPMEGRQGFLDALRGSTTERIVREVVRPVLALPT